MLPTFGRFLKPLLCAALFAALALSARPALADDNPWDGNLHFGLTPYIWGPTINATFKYDLSDFHQGLPSGNLNSQIGPNSYLSHLNFALMAAASLRKGDFAVYTDFININASNQGTTIYNIQGPLGHVYTFSGQASSHAVATLWTIGPSFTIFNAQGTHVDALIGGRFAWLKGSLQYSLTTPDGLLNPNGSASRTDTLSDIVGGTYGDIGLGSHWSVPFYFDFGTGHPSFTFEGLLGVKYGQASLSWRQLEYGSGTGFTQILKLGGPMFGYTFRF